MAVPSFAVQVAFATSSIFTGSPTWTDISADLIDVSITRGRQRELDQPQAGTATFTFDNLSWQYTPGYSSGANSPNVLPGRQIQFKVTVGATTYSLFRGYIDRWETQWHDPGYSTVVVQATDALGLFANLNAVGLFPQQSVNARLAALLTAAGWPAALQNIGSESTVCSYITLGWSDQIQLLQILQQTIDSVPGTLYVDGSGVVQYVSAFSGSALPGTLGDRPDLGEVQIDDAVLALPRDTVFNDIHGARENAQTTPNSTFVPSVRVQDAGSQTEFGPNMISKQTYNLNDTALTTAISGFLSRYKYPTQLVDPVTIMPAGDLNSAYAFCCSCEIGATVTLNRTPPPASGLGRFSQACVVNYLEHQIKPGGSGGEWQTMLRLAGGSFH